MSKGVFLLLVCAAAGGCSSGRVKVANTSATIPVTTPVEVVTTLPATTVPTPPTTSPSPSGPTAVASASASASASSGSRRVSTSATVISTPSAVVHNSVTASCDTGNNVTVGNASTNVTVVGGSNSSGGSASVSVGSCRAE